jgi:lipopolysaccharide/colanic/teichoic acid biosynthesis glycosyltransferase
VLLLAPTMIAIAIMIKLDSPGPVLHRRRVLGVAGKSFHAFKFRTMVVNADEVLASNPQLRDAFEKGYKLRRDPRVTRVGSFLRRTSLDELPQLLNVLRGEMSVVGPRMITAEEAGRYGKWDLNLLTVKPGITGPWQVHGRSDLPYAERVRLSMRYIRDYTIWLDLEIILRTVFVVLTRKGAY